MTLAGLAPILRAVTFAALAYIGTPALGQVDPLSGVDFVTVGAPGNAPWTGGGLNNGRGQVDYEYRIGRMEVTTAQWVEFFNAALDRPITDRIPHVFAPVQWGATAATPQNGGERFAVTAANALLPAGGVDWRTSAIYCNWLHNGKATNREAFLSGAYDVSTFTYFNEGSTFTDQLTRSPGARYFIPSLDEWMKAAHWSPTNPSNNGWYLYSNASDTPHRYGPAGVLINGQPATANSGWDSFNFPGHNPFAIPLGAYGATSPWGLLDVAGGTSEWTEATFRISDETYPRGRVLEGSAWNRGAFNSDQVGSRAGSIFPTFFGEDVGLRIAAVVPSPGAGLPAMVSILTYRFLGRRRSKAAMRR